METKNYFQGWFGDKEVEIPKKLKLVSKTLEKPMTDKEILDQWKPEEVTLGDFAYALNNWEKCGLLRNSYANIFYIDGRVVYARWDAGRGWDVNAHEVSSPDAWDDGYRAFSRKFLLGCGRALGRRQRRLARRRRLGDGSGRVGRWLSGGFPQLS